MTEIADKMAVRGVESLTDRELLTALVEDGRLAGALLDAYGGSLARMADEPACAWSAGWGCGGHGCCVWPRSSGAG